MEKYRSGSEKDSCKEKKEMKVSPTNRPWHILGQMAREALKQLLFIGRKYKHYQKFLGFPSENSGTKKLSVE